MKKSVLVISLLVCGLAVVACQKNKEPTEPEESYNIIRPSFDGDFTTYAVSEKPSGVNMTYYSDIYSRGFSWITDTTATETELYLVKSDKGQDADFSNAEFIEGTSIEGTYKTNGEFSAKNNVIASHRGSSNSSELNFISHKAHVENLEKGKAYSYKIGSEKGYYYGAFIVEKDNPKTITALHMSDAQTKEPDKLNVWRNTFTRAVDTAGKGLDMTLYNGDQFDQNMRINGTIPLRFTMYSKALDVINDYKIDIPYMTSSGNHEPASPYSHYLHSDINYAGFDYSGGYYSYDYNFAHFVVLNTNNEISSEQLTWLNNDLENASNAKWKIVMMHISPYSTGDNSVDSENHRILEKVTPIFSQKHVDLVLQAHDHTYNKTLPYKWDHEKGYTKTAHDETVVNYNPQTEQKGDITYDKNPNGTYYVTTGAAGHRAGAPETDGVYAEVVVENGEIKPLNPSKSYLNSEYKIEVGTLKYENEYESYTVDSYVSDQHYEVGDPATGNVNAQMFGVLNLSESTLSYNVYTVNEETVKLFDSLDILKS